MNLNDRINSEWRVEELDKAEVKTGKQFPSERRYSKAFENFKRNQDYNYEMTMKKVADAQIGSMITSIIGFMGVGAATTGIIAGGMPLVVASMAVGYAGAAGMGITKYLEAKKTKDYFLNQGNFNTFIKSIDKLHKSFSKKDYQDFVEHTVKNNSVLTNALMNTSKSFAKVEQKNELRLRAKLEDLMDKNKIETPNLDKKRNLRFS